MALRFRNLTVTPDDPVDQWGVEGILTAIDRGGRRDWLKIVAAVSADPRGEVAADLEEALGLAESTASAAAVRNAVAHATLSARERTRERLRQAYLATDLSQAEVARRLGTSPSRLSTYLNGSVMPSAELLVRLEDLARKRRGELA